MNAILSEQELSASINKFMSRKLEKYPELYEASQQDSRSKSGTSRNYTNNRYFQDTLRSFGVSAQGYIMKGI